MRVQASSGFAFPSPVAYGVWDHSGVGAGYGHVCPRREIEGARRAGGPFSQLTSNMQPHWARISKTVNSVCRPGVLVCLGNAPIAKNSMTCRDNRYESMKVPTQVQSGTGHDGR